MFNKKRIVVIVLFLILSFLLITYGASRGNAKVNVTFVDGYDDKIIDKQVINEGEDAEVPENPEHINYVFAGWYLYDSIDTLITNFEKIEKDLKVEARYEGDINNNEIPDKDEEYYDVNFIDGVTGSILKTENVLTGMGATAPITEVHTNYTFVGWDKDYSNITSDLDVVANYNYNNIPVANVYTLRFHDINGNVFNTQTIASGNAGGYVAAPIYPGYTFNGWYLGLNGTGNSYAMGSIVTNNLDVYSYYTLDKHEIIIDPEDGDIDGGDNPIEEEQIVDYGTEVILPNALKEYILTYHANGENAEVIGSNKFSRNAILLGWCKEGTDCSTLIKVGTKVTITEDTKYKAVWGNANSAIILTNALRTMTDSTIYTFAGWALTSNGAKEYDENYSLTLSKDLDLYALWDENARKYDVVFNDEIDEETNPDELDDENKIEYGTDIKLPGSNKNYILTYDLNNGTSLTNGNLTNTLSVEFLGWCEGVKTCDTPLKSDTVLTNKEYNAVFAPKSEKIVLTSAIRNADNYNTYEFLGWDTSKNANNPMYTKENIASGLEIELTENVKLYAIWKSTPIDYTLSLNPNGGTISNEDEIETTYGYDEETNDFPMPTMNYEITYHLNGGKLDDTNIDRVAAAKFLGWCEGTSDACDTYVTKTKMTSDKTYTAAWGTSEEELIISGANKEQTESITYTFGGWALTENGTKVYDKESKIKLDSDKDFYAIWVESAREYDVVIDSNVTDNTEGGLIDNEENNPSDLDEGRNIIDYGTKVKLPNAKNYYILTYVPGEGNLLNGAKEVNYVEATFMGWCNKTICTDSELLPALTEVTVNEGITYTAIWGITKNSTVIADANKTDDKEYDYTFEGWSIANNDTIDYLPNDSTAFYGNVTLYAKYSKIKQKYDIIINGNIDENNNPDDLENENELDHGTEFDLPNALLDYTLTYHTGLGKVVSGNNTVLRAAEFLGWCEGNTTCITKLKAGDTQTVTKNAEYNPIFGNATETIKVVGASKDVDNYNTYRFLGWATSENGTVDARYNVGNDIVLNGNLDLYAVYESETINYTLTLNPNGGVIDEENKIETTYEYNETTEVFPIPTKSFTLTYDANGGSLNTDDYENEAEVAFLGWCEGTSDACDTYVTSTKMTSNKTYTAVWGDAEELDLISASKTSTTTETFTFDGWSDGNNKYTNKIILTKNTNLVANYIVNVRYYEVCFDSAYDKDNLPENQIKEYKDLVTPVEDLSSREHEFIGWVTENDTNWNFLEDKVLENLTLYAKWNNALAFETNGGQIEGVSPSALQEENAEINLPNATKKYTLTYETNGGVSVEDDTVSATFLGWCKDSTSCVSPLEAGTKQTIATNTKYYAIWGFATDEITLPSTTKTADNYNIYTFKGWSVTSNGEVNYTSDFDLLIEKDTTLYAVWEKTPIEYTLTLNPNGGTISENDMIETSYGYGEITSNFPTPTKNYTLTYNSNGGVLDNENVDKVAAAKFLGWCEGISDVCDTYVTNVEMISNKTYTAAWGTSEEALTLTGATKSPTIDTVYTFKEWYYGDTIKVAGNTIYLSNDLTVNARYTESIRNYTVIFDNNGYGSEPENQIVGFGDKAINPGELSQTGYEFDNWYKDNALITPWSFNEDTVNENTINEDGNVYIYGNMTKKNYKLTVSVSGGTATYNVNYTLNSDKYVVPFNNEVNITNITPQIGYYVKEIKLNNTSQTITSGTRTFSFNMPALDTNVEIVLAKLTEEVLEANSPIRSFYIESRWIDIRLKSSYMTCTGTRNVWDRESEKYIQVPKTCSIKGFNPTIYYSTIERSSEEYLLDNSINLGNKYNNPVNAWDTDASQGELENIKIDGGYHYHLDGISSLNNYKYFYVVYEENNTKYIIEYKRGTGVNYTIESFYSMKLS